MDKTLILGIASYKAPEKLARTIASIQQQSTGILAIHIFHNPSPDDNHTREVICGAADRDPRITPHWMPENIGYAGAVAELQRVALSTPGWGHIAYADNDIQIYTRGWDAQMAALLDAHPEIGIVFPNGGPYPIPRDGYTEVLWGVGFCWMMSRKACTETGPFDTTIGHQEEADYAIRLRLKGYDIAALPSVQVHHDATATNDPASQERINRGVVRWVDKHNAYFNGKQYGYHHPQVTRILDWPPCALYMERYFRTKAPDLNANPETVRINGEEFDLIRVPRPKFFYRDRII